jgi:hypothetical protein
MSTSDDIAAIVAYYLQKQDASKTPNTYPIPPTPTEVYQLEQKKRSDALVGPYIQQFLAGTSNLNPSDFHFNSPAYKGQAFAGGLKMPVITMPLPGGGAGTTTPTTTTPPTTPGGGSSTPGAGSTIGNGPSITNPFDQPTTTQREPGVKPGAGGLVPQKQGDLTGLFQSSGDLIPGGTQRYQHAPPATGSTPDPSAQPGGADLIKEAHTLAQQVKAGLTTIEQVFKDHPYLTKLGGAILGAIFGGPAGALAGYRGAGALTGGGGTNTPPPAPALPPGSGQFPQNIRDRRVGPPGNP